MILKPKDIDISSIKLKKKISVGNNSYNYPISYRDNNLIVQTPIVYIPFDISSYNNRNYLHISFLNCDNDDEMNEFKQFVLNTEKNIQKKFKKNRKFISSVKNSINYAPRLQLSINKDIQVYNNNNNLIDFSLIQKKEYGKFLIQPDIVWYNNNCYGIIWNILQAKLYIKFKLKEYSFIDDEPININKYKQMVKVGVPFMAVKLKMEKDGIDPNLLDKNINNKIPISIPIPIPPPPPPPPLTMTQPNKITPNMLAGVKLKKSKINQNKKDIPMVLSLKPMIDLKEILAIRNKLKNI